MGGDLEDTKEYSRGGYTPPKIDSGTERFPLTGLVVNPMNPIGLDADLAANSIYDIETPDSQPTPDENKSINFNNVALMLKTAGLISSATDAARSPEREKLQLNENASEVESLMENRGINLDAVTQDINLAANANLQSNRNSGNLQTSQALAQSLFSRIQRQLSANSIQAQQANNNYRAEEARVKQGLGTEERQYRRETDVANAQNRAMAQEFGANFFGDLASIGSQFNKKDIVDKTIRGNAEIAAMTRAEGTAYLQSRYPDFTITSDIYDIIKQSNEEGKQLSIDDIVEYRAKKKS